MSHSMSISIAGDDSKIVRFTLPESLGVNRIDGETIPANATTQFNMNFPVSGLNAFWLQSSVDCALIINTDVPGTADEITVKAGKPILWYLGIGYNITSLIGGSAVTKIFIHNYGATAGTLNAIALYDPTP